MGRRCREAGSAERPGGLGRTPGEGAWGRRGGDAAPRGGGEYCTLGESGHMRTRAREKLAGTAFRKVPGQREGELTGGEDSGGKCSGRALSCSDETSRGPGPGG